MPRFFGNGAQPERVYIADMRTESGDSLIRSSETVGTRMALQLADLVAETPAYRVLTELLPQDKVALYFEKLLRDQTYPAIRSVYIADWYNRNQPSNSSCQVIWHGHPGLGSLLQSAWPSASISLQLGPPPRGKRIGKQTLVRQYKRARRLGERVRRILSRSGNPQMPRLPGPTIAVHYAQSFDSGRRSDLFWFEASRVEPQRVLILFDSHRAGYTARRVPEATLRNIEGMGLNWVCLEHDVVARQNPPVWKPEASQDSLLSRFQQSSSRPVGPVEQWLHQASEWLLGEVDYWVDCYRAFNVKVLMDVVGGSGRHIAQGIALDLLDGVRIGWQQAESHTPEGAELGHFPNHVHFAWNERAESYVERNRNRIDSLVISGFPYDGALAIGSDGGDLRSDLAAKGASFIVAFFDNDFWWEGPYSRNMVSGFYEAFLRWVLEDPQIGVVAKSKKTNPISKLPDLAGLMDAAEATGRWINLPDPYGRMPSDASRAADMSVGIGMSSAVSEAAAAGRRGISCDLSAEREHPFYAWGYEKVVFDNLDRMMAAIKRYKEDPGSEPGLGDFSNMMDQVDPFHDGRAGERAGVYVRWLLEGFDEGKDRDAAIGHANERYAREWGSNKVISFKAPV